MRPAWTLFAAFLLVALPASAGTPALTVAILDVEATRSASGVTVFVDLAGTAPDLLGLATLPVSGEVHVTSPTPCWPDFPGACTDVVTTKSRSYLGTGLLATWEARVGPFEYPADPLGSACERLEIVAEAEAGGARASDRTLRLVCP